MRAALRLGRCFVFLNACSKWSVSIKLLTDIQCLKAVVFLMKRNELDGALDVGQHGASSESISEGTSMSPLKKSLSSSTFRESFSIAAANAAPSESFKTAVSVNNVPIVNGESVVSENSTELEPKIFPGSNLMVFCCFFVFLFKM